jgi:hypothetical protein
MPAKKAAAAISVAVTLLDDGSNLISVVLSDTDGLPITPTQLNGTFPAALLATAPTFTFADATPGPSAFTYTALATPAVSTAVAGAFDLGSAVAVTPYVAGSGQGVDTTCTISGFPNGAVSEDGGTWTIVSDPSKPGGFSTVVT